MWIAKVKQATTIATQMVLVDFDFAVEMRANPCIVEFSRKSLTVAKTILITESLSHNLLCGTIFVITSNE